MKKLLSLSLIIALLSFFIACGGGNPPPKNSTNSKTVNKTPEKTPVSQADLGAKVYKQFCQICHGANGTIGANGAANLVESTLSLEEKIEVIKKGRKTMAGFEGMLGAEKVKAVADYVHAFSQK